jgi:hypothetical protein
MSHSKIVGGSTAKRVMACPGSVALCNKMPPQVENEYMAKGTLLHNAMDRIFSSDIPPKSVIGMQYAGQVLTEEVYEDKISAAMCLVDELDPAGDMELETETQVGFGKLLPDVFGTTDVIGRLNGRAVVLDWKFGDGVPVGAEENEQLMFYAAAAMRTPETMWAFEGVTEVELVIIQPPHIRRWTTTVERIRAFEQDLICAVSAAQKPNAKLVAGEHCRFCAARPVCPQITGAVDRAIKTKIDGLDVAQINAYLKNADVLEGWIKDLRALAFQMMDKGVTLPDWKLVAKRGTRKWTKEEDAKAALLSLGVKESDITVTELLSPAQAEKVLKKHKLALPEDVVVSVSSGSTLAERSDPRPEVLQIGQQLAGLSKLV